MLCCIKIPYIDAHFLDVWRLSDVSFKRVVAHASYQSNAASTRVKLSGPNDVDDDPALVLLRSLLHYLLSRDSIRAHVHQRLASLVKHCDLNLNGLHLIVGGDSVSKIRSTTENGCC